VSYLMFSTIQTLLVAPQVTFVIVGALVVEVIGMKVFLDEAKEFANCDIFRFDLHFPEFSQRYDLRKDRQPRLFLRVGNNASGTTGDVEFAPFVLPQEHSHSATTGATFPTVNLVCGVATRVPIVVTVETGYSLHPDSAVGMLNPVLAQSAKVTWDALRSVLSKLPDELGEKLRETDFVHDVNSLFSKPPRKQYQVDDARVVAISSDMTVCARAMVAPPWSATAVALHHLRMQQPAH
jgi:hypothetical protein